MRFSVIPAEAGIQDTQTVTNNPNSGACPGPDARVTGVTIFYEAINMGGLVKSLSVPLGAGLRCNFVVVPRNAGYVRLTPQFLRALSRLWRESFLRVHQH